jgi:hypothetical protein
MLVRCAIAALVLLLSAIERVSPISAQDPLEMLVSLIQLIANPTAFDQKRVVVIGYVRLQFEHQQMYLSEADAKHGVTRNGVWLDVSATLYAKRAEFDRRYLLVEGTFNARRRGHLGLSSGQIENIGRFELVD